MSALSVEVAIIHLTLVFSHMEVRYENVRVPEANIIAGWGRGFEVIQGRLGEHGTRTASYIF